jgi:methanogenic corrinoid protein MtbC1
MIRLEVLAQAVIDGASATAKVLIQEAIDAKKDPAAAINNGLIAGINKKLCHAKM